MNFTPRKRRGFILLGVLILVMLISMIALSLMFRLRADETASAATAGGDQAFSAAMTGVQEAMRVVKEMKPGLTDWEDDPRTFRSPSRNTCPTPDYRIRNLIDAATRGRTLQHDRAAGSVQFGGE